MELLKDEPSCTTFREEPEDDVSQKSQQKPGGNTKTPGPKMQLYCWVFTMDAEEITASQLSQLLKGFCKKFSFQLEKGKKTGWLHYQGRFSLKTKEYFQTVLNLLPYATHIEPEKDYFASMNYTKKQDTRVDGPWDEKSTFLKLPKKLYPWQQKVIDKLAEEPDDRSINWYWEPDGCKGKTTLIKYIYNTFKGVNIIGNGAFKDIAYAIDNCPKIVLMNITRTTEEHVNYGAIEAIKDGLVFSAKYESGVKVFDSPHVFVFANFKPDIEAMSKDRWKITRLL